MVGNCTGASCAFDDRFARSDKSVFGARPMRAGCEEEAHSSSCRPCVPASLVDSSGRTHRGRVSLTPWMRALIAAAAPAFGAPVHSGTSSPSDGRHRRLVAGRGCAALQQTAHRPHVPELWNRSLRQNSVSLAKQVA